MKKVGIFLLALGLILAGNPAAQAAFVKANPVTSALNAVATATPKAASEAISLLSGAGTSISFKERGLVVRQQRRLLLKAIRAGFKSKFRRQPKGIKSRLTAALLCFFFGALGVHRFYLGYTLIGLLQLLAFLLLPLFISIAVLGTITAATVFTVGIFPIFVLLGYLVWILTDFVRIITGDLKPKYSRYD